MVGRDPAWVVDPGPALEDHLDAVAEAVAARGGAGGIVLTHDHADHSEGAGALSRRLGVAPSDGLADGDAVGPFSVLALRERLGRPPVAARRLAADVRLADGMEFGPLTAVAVPGHAPDHLAFVAGGACFTGDAVLGEGSVFISEDLAGYLDALARLRDLPLEVICPGHGPPVWDPMAKLDEYMAHRAERERKLLEALAQGMLEEDELLDAVWSDAPPALRPAAAVTLGAHREKLEAEGRWPRPDGGRPGP